jgi:hypothetical protein
MYLNVPPYFGVNAVVVAGDVVFSGVVAWVVAVVLVVVEHPIINKLHTNRNRRETNIFFIPTS